MEHQVVLEKMASLDSQDRLAKPVNKVLQEMMAPLALRAQSESLETQLLDRLDPLARKDILGRGATKEKMVLLALMVRKENQVQLFLDSKDQLATLDNLGHLHTTALLARLGQKETLENLEFDA